MRRWLSRETALSRELALTLPEDAPNSHRVMAHDMPRVPVGLRTALDDCTRLTAPHRTAQHRTQRNATHPTMTAP